MQPCGDGAYETLECAHFLVAVRRGRRAFCVARTRTGVYHRHRRLQPARECLSTALAYPRVLAFAQNLGGKAVLFVVIALFLWHAAHRIYHCLHDFGVHPGLTTKLMLYGSALAGTVAAAVLLLTIRL